MATAPIPPLPPVPPLTKDGFTDPVWARWLQLVWTRIKSNVSAVTFDATDGISGSTAIDNMGELVVTLSVTASGMLKGVAGAIVPAVAGTDYIIGVTATAPLSQSGGGTPNIAMTQASGSDDGWLSATDWATFNDKQDHPVPSSDFAAGTTGTGLVVLANGPTVGNITHSGAMADMSKSVQVPLTGFTITIADGVSTLILDPAGTLATGTITLPATPLDGQEVRVTSSQTITALTVSPNAGQSVANAPTTLAVSLTGPQGYEFIYHAANTTWYRLQ